MELGYNIFNARFPKCAGMRTSPASDTTLIRTQINLQYHINSISKNLDFVDVQVHDFLFDQGVPPVDKDCITISSLSSEKGLGRVQKRHRPDQCKSRSEPRSIIYFVFVV